MSADVLRVRIEGRVVIRMARTIACANQVSLAEIAKWVGLSYTCFYFRSRHDECDDLVNNMVQMCTYIK